MKILFTGGTGLIGSAFISKFGARHEFTVLSRRPARARQELDNAVNTLASLNELDNLDGFDAVINLAGEPIADKRWTRNQKKRIERSRWNITEKLAELFKASEKPPEVLISGSAIGYYGRQGKEPVTENKNTPNKEFSHFLCKKWEKLATDIASDRTRVCILRTGIVLAPEGGALNRMKLPFKLFVGGPVGNGEQMMSWVHLDDMVDILDFLLNCENCDGVYNATAPNPASNEDFSKTLAKVMERPCFFRVPAFVLKLGLGEMSDLLLTGQAVLPERLQKAGYEFRYPELERALKQCV